MGKVKGLEIWCVNWPSGLQTKKYKSRPEGAWLRYMTYFYNFCTHYYSNGTAEHTKVTFGGETDHKRYYSENAKN